MYFATLNLLCNNILNIYNCVFNKNLYKLDLSKTNIKLANIICALFLFNNKRKSVLKK